MQEVQVRGQQPSSRQLYGSSRHAATYYDANRHQQVVVEVPALLPPPRHAAGQQPRQRPLLDEYDNAIEGDGRRRELAPYDNGHAHHRLRDRQLPPAADGDNNQHDCCYRFVEPILQALFSENALKFHLLCQWMCCLVLLLVISEKNSSEVVFAISVGIALSLLLSVIGILSETPKLLYPFVLVTLFEFVLAMSLMILILIKQWDAVFFHYLMADMPEFYQTFAILFRAPETSVSALLAAFAFYSFLCTLTAFNVIPLFEYRMLQQALYRQHLAEAYDLRGLHPGVMRGPYVHVIERDAQQFVSENPDSPPHYSVLIDSSQQKTPVSPSRRSDRSASLNSSPDKETAPPRYSQLESLILRKHCTTKGSKQEAEASSRRRGPGRLRAFFTPTSSPRKSTATADRQHTASVKSESDQTMCSTQPAATPSISSSSLPSPIGSEPAALTSSHSPTQLKHKNPNNS